MKKKVKAKRTVQYGLGALSSSVVIFPETITEKMGKILIEALDSKEELEEREQFVITHAYKAAQFRKLQKDKKTDEKLSEQLFRKIKKSEEAGLRIGFSESEIKAINYFILNEDQSSNLQYLFRKLKEKIGTK